MPDNNEYSDFHVVASSLRQRPCCTEARAGFPATLESLLERSKSMNEKCHTATSAAATNYSDVERRSEAQTCFEPCASVWQPDAKQIKAHVIEKWSSLRSIGNNGHVARVAIFGAGAHSSWLQTTVHDIDGPIVVAVLDDAPSGKPALWGKNVTSSGSWDPKGADAIILSSDTVTDLMKRRCQQLYGVSVKAVSLYDGLPPGPYPKMTAPIEPVAKTVVSADDNRSKDKHLPPLLFQIPFRLFDRRMSNYLPDPAIVQREHDLRWKAKFVFYAYGLKKRFKECHLGRKAILVGSGPSVRIEDLEQFKRFVTFACNRFYRCYDRTTFRPTYLASADSSMVNDFGEEMSREAKCPVFLNTQNKPAGSKSNVFWLPSTIPHRSSLVFQETMFRGLFCGGGTLITAIQIGYYMGIRRFYLYGVDHNFNYQKVETRDRTRSASGDGNHFIPNYRDGKAWFPPATRLIEESFSLCDKFLRNNGGYVKNATRGGKLEVLERIDIEDVLG
jgi:hypothetical protein